ncbi:MAG: tryptophan-rich sensory protein [Oscillospiraceae bacterium]|nr:tryptophan-rich sensory protein [Oscillospiraceae bacterium]
MKIKWKKLLICIAVPITVGALSALLTRDSMSMFEAINKPKLSPQGWLFPVVWTILYVFMGIASYIVLQSDDPLKRNALGFYALQLVFNFFWSIIFFNLETYLLAFIWLLILWVLILVTMLKFYRISERAGDLMLPYLLWVTFAAYLNYGIYLLN